jgi:hypothetical protein
MRGVICHLHFSSLQKYDALSQFAAYNLTSLRRKLVFDNLLSNSAGISIVTLTIISTSPLHFGHFIIPPPPVVLLA